MNHRTGARGVGAWGLWVGLTTGCPSAPDPAPLAEAPPAPAPAGDPFRREAHTKALVQLRAQSMPALRLLDPVAAAQVEGTPLRPPGFGATMRVALRDPLERAQREAAGIRTQWLSPDDGVVLRAHVTALDRGLEHLRQPPWRDDPRGVMHTMSPYLHQLASRVAAGECDAGCGIEQLGPALADAFDEVGSASPPTLAATRQDLAALAASLPRLTAGLPATHPVVQAQPALAATLAELDATLDRAATALPAAEELPWSTVAPRASPEAWKRRPARWGAPRLREWLQTEEAYGHDPRMIFDRARATAARLRMMIDRDAGATDRSAAIGRPFDATGCATAFAPIDTWVKGQSPTHLVADLDCAALVRELGTPVDPPLDDAALTLRMIDRGIIEPTRRAQLAATPPDLAMIRGRAAPLAQAITLEVAITAATEHRAAERLALEHGRHAACLAATAVWIHAELGPLEELRASLEPAGCDDLDPLVTSAEQRPRAALAGLGLLLLGMGPADAAALDRYWWAPIGLVRDLALPPLPIVESPPPVHIESLEPGPAVATD